MPDDFPKAVRDKPKPDDVVQVLMTEDMARRFERRCLGKGNTVGDTRLSPALVFSADDLPTYLITSIEPGDDPHGAGTTRPDDMADSPA